MHVDGLTLGNYKLGPLTNLAQVPRRCRVSAATPWQTGAADLLLETCADMRELEKADLSTCLHSTRKTLHLTLMMLPIRLQWSNGEAHVTEQ